MEITKTLTTNPKPEPDWQNLGFGNVTTDHMFIMDYSEGRGWHDARIIPYGPLSLDPAAIVLHYGVEVFEGLKAYHTEDDKILLFRPQANARRINNSSKRLCIPELPEEYFVQAIKELVDIDRNWTPKLPDTSLYIRPLIIATEAQLGVKRADEYKFIVILSPVGAYYAEGLNPVKIFVEDEYVRSVRGGTGFTKCGGNYAAGLAAQYKAKQMGYSQVLWLDGAERKYIDEVGTMNVMFKINGEVITPELSGGTILPGVTRDSVLQLLQTWGIPTCERRITLEELHQAAQNNTLEEAFGTGTAAVISPIGMLNIHGQEIAVSNGQIGQLTQKIYDALTDIQWGRVADTLGWTVEV
ncbi:MAG: branched-chain amino acid aminotransferase [Firmicutes bacterium]|nr:branched-chain amino acid aminotransferase [Bacillota bacterium]